jgi:Domain of unknown function (DUF4249)
MRMKSRILVILSGLLIAVTLALSSCELIVEVDIPDEPPHIVLNGLQRSDSTWYVSLYQNRSVLTNLQQPWVPVNSATVRITGDDGTSIDLQQNGYGFYSSETEYPIPGRHYKIQVSASGFDAVESEMRMPCVVPIVNIEWDSTNVPTGTQPNKYYLFTMPFKIRFQDPPTEKNFYTVYLHIYGEAIWYDQFTGEQMKQNFLNTRAVRIRNTSITENDDEFVSIWSDETFNGEVFEAFMDTQFNVQPNQTIHRIEVSLFNVSQEQFNYLETMRFADEVEGDPFAQPVQVYSNVIDGFGVFGGSTGSTVVYERAH